ncbi:MAG: RNA polymerase sigma-70 factor [Prolixibacteraceae bacterium]
MNNLKNDNKFDLRQKVTELSHGDEAAFRCLFEYYSQDVKAYSIRFVKDNVFAEEITQDVFVKLWTHRANLKAELSFEAFIFTVTRNMCFNFLKKAAHERELAKKIFLEEPIESSSSDYKLIDAEYWQIGQRAVKNLPPRCRQVYKLSRNQGKSYEEISNELGISPNTVKNQMSKALGLMREYLMANSDIVFLVLVGIYLS